MAFRRARKRYEIQETSSVQLLNYTNTAVLRSLAILDLSSPFIALSLKQSAAVTTDRACIRAIFSILFIRTSDISDVTYPEESPDTLL